MKNQISITMCVTFLVFLKICVSSGGAKAGEMNFHIECYGNAIESCYIIANGSITNETPKIFEKFLRDEWGDTYQIAINSAGGDIVAGMKIGRLIRKNGLKTYVGKWSDDLTREKILVDGRCFSACAYAFLGGTSRNIQDGSSLGFHQFSISSDLKIPDEFSSSEILLSNAQAMSGIIVGYIVEMGADARIFSLATKANNKEIFVPTKVQLEDYDFITLSGYSAFAMEPYKNGVMAFSKRLEPPRAYDEIVQITTFCQSATPVVLLTSPKKILLNKDDILESGLTVVNGGISNLIPFGLEQIQISDGKNGLQILVSLKQSEAKQMITAEQAGVAIWATRVAGHRYRTWHTFSAMDRSMINSSFIHCIDG